MEHVINEDKSIINNLDISKLIDNDIKLSDMPVIDSDWIRSRFITPDKDLDPEYYKTRYKTTASSKYTDSSLGGNIGINPRPQFTHYADIIDNGSVASKTPVTVMTTGKNRTNLGQGRYYSEAIDDNTETIFMQYGVARFNSWLDFATKSIDYVDSTVANTGRIPKGYLVGKFVGNLAMLAAFPLITMGIWAGKFLTKMLSNGSTFKYYYFESTMWTYWSTVNQIVSSLTAELGLLIPEFMEDKPAPKGMQSIGMPVTISQNHIDELKAILPDGVIGDNNYIDVFAIATKSQRKAIKYKQEEYDALKNGLSFQDTIRKSNSILDTIDDALQINNFFKEVNHSLSKLPKADEAKELPDPASATAYKNKDQKASNYTRDKYGRYIKREDTPEEASALKNFAKAFDSSVRQGGAFAAFNVDYTGSVSESFSNTTSQINAGASVKQMALKARNIKFDMAGGNFIGNLQKDIIDGAKNVIAGALDSVTFGLSNVIQTLSGGGYIDMPKKWDDSSMTLPSISYKMQLISPYNNIVSQLQNIYIPLCMILAGALPLSAGKSSYTSPFLCTIFNKGKQNVQLGMITSLSITRGVSNLGFDKRRRPLAIDVSFTVTDFSTMITSPINTSAFQGLFKTSIDNDTPFGNYLSILGGRDLLSNMYATYRLKIQLTKRSSSLEQLTNGYSYGMLGGNALAPILGPILSVRSLSGQHVNKDH